MSTVKKYCGESGINVPLNSHHNKLLNVWYKLKKLKEPLKHINIAHFQKIPEKLSLIRDQLTNVQSQLGHDYLNNELMNEETQLLTELEKWSTIEEQIWQQKSRVDWIKLGDSNTKFFHAYAKARQTGKAIKMLIREDGERCSTQAQILKEVRDFYSSLMGTASEILPTVDKNVVEKGYCLSNDQQRLLSESFSAQEIKDGLFSMSDAKAPGIDGYNAYFYKYNWGVVGNEVIAAVQEFFRTGYLPALLENRY